MPRNHWDIEIDTLVVGTGAAGLADAIAAADKGASVLIVESLPYWGGTTSWSGGGAWVPANSLMKKAGFDDSADEAMTYLNAVVKDLGAPTSPERKRAFVNSAPLAFDLLQSRGVKWMSVKTQPDYYPEEVGGKVAGRTLESLPIDVHLLGEWEKSWNGARGDIQLPLLSEDIKFLCRAWSSWSGVKRTLRVIGRIAYGKLRRQRLIAAGGGFSTHLFKAVIEAGIDVWLSSPLTELIVENNSVVGAIISKNGRTMRIRTRGGILLAAGGFAKRTEWRQGHQGIAGWSAASDGDTGSAIEIAKRIGAALAMMDQAWWTPTFEGPDGKTKIVLFERSMPHGLMVNQEGKRFVNESTSYSDVGHAMLRNSTDENAPNLGADSPAVPCWLIGDRRLSRRYLYQPNMFGKEGKAKLKATNTYFEANTLDELAAATGLPAKQLVNTVKRFNGFASTGIDADFRRGESRYDHIYSDPGVKPNPNLGKVEKGPFSALRIDVGDIGTKGGLVTDEHARVLREDGSVIEGLYAAGNSTASVMGDTYPGAGATLGPAVTFGYLGGRHASDRVRRNIAAAE